MAIIYSYPTVDPAKTDLILGTDISANGKPTKNFTVQGIIDLVTIATGDLQTVLDLGEIATGKDIVLGTRVVPTQTMYAGTFTTGSAQIVGAVGTGFTDFTSTRITGTIQAASAAQPNITSLGALTALVINGAISGTNVITSTVLAGALDTNIASTLAIKTYVDSNPAGAESLAATLLVGNTTSGTDIAISAGDDVTFTNTSKILMGTTAVDNFEIYSDSLNSIVIDRSPGALQLQTSLLSVKNEADTETILSGTAGAAVDLYFNNAKKFETLTGGAKVTGAFEATGSGTFVNILNTGTYSDSSGDVGSAGQILSSTASGTNWVTELPLYTWSYEGTNIPSATAMTVTDGANITTTWDAATFDLTIATTGVPTGSGTQYQVTYWDPTNALTGAAGFTFAGGASGKVTVAGELEASTLSDGTFSGSAGTYTGGVSITSTTFVGALSGNASTATALAAAGQIQLSGDATSPAYTYTSGGAVGVVTSIADTVVTGKVLTGLPTPAAASITAGDTILSAFGKTQSQINSIANGLQFQGTWDANTNTPTLASGGGEATSGTTDGATTTDKLIDSTANFTATVTIGDKVVNQVDGQTALVSAIDSATVLSIDTDIMLTGEAYTIDNTPFITQGHYYVVSVAGSTSLNGISDWVIGDWVIAGATNVWEKLDGTAVQGTGTDNYLTKWNGTGVSSIVDSGVTDDGSTIKLLNDVELGTAASDTTIVKGPATFDENTRFDKSISIGAAYGVAGQVFTSGGGSGAINTWTTPLTGTVTSVALTETGDALTITGSPITSSGTFNIAGAGSASQYINGALNLTTFPTLDNYVSWTADSDEGTDITVTTGFNLKFTGAVEAGGAGISTDSAISADEMTIGLINAGGTAGATTFYRGDGNWAVPAGTGVTGSGTLNTVARWTATGSILGDGPIVFSSATTTADSTFGGNVKVESASTNGLIVNSTDAASIRGLDIQHSGVSRAVFDFHPNSGEIRIGGITTSDEYPVIYSDGIASLTFGLGATPSATFVGSGTFAGDVTIDNASSVSKLTIEAGIPSSVTGQAIIDLISRSSGSGTSPISRIVGIFEDSNDSAITLSTTEGGVLLEKMRIKSTGAIQFNNYGSGTHTGTEAYTLGVDSSGNIIETASSGGGGGIFYGDQAIVTGSSDLTFTLTRATTGTLIFDVWFTSETSTATSVAKKYVVAHSYATTPVYNKIIDTGPDGSNDFTVVFANSDTGAAGTSVTCSIQAVGIAQNIGYTIQVGHDSANALTFTAAS